jgi:hypothetical protein
VCDAPKVAGGPAVPTVPRPVRTSDEEITDASEVFREMADELT